MSTKRFVSHTVPTAAPGSGAREEKTDTTPGPEPWIVHRPSDCRGGKWSAILLTLGSLLSVAALAPVSTAGAAWTEGTARILTVEDLLPALQGEAGPAVDAGEFARTPIVIPDGWDPASPKAALDALLLGGLRVTPRAGIARVERMHPETDEAQARRRLAVQPALPMVLRAPQAGAPGRGGVLLYGEMLAPPFRVEVEGDAVMVNGVAVFPVPGIPAATMRVPPETAARHRSMDAAADAYEKDRASLGPVRAGDLLITRLRGMPGIVEASWATDEEVRIVRGNGIEEYLSFAPDRDAPPPTAEDQAEFLESEAAALRSALESDHTVVAGATYLFTVPEPAAPALRERLAAVRDSSEPEALRAARIQALLGQRDAAVDLLYAR